MIHGHISRIFGTGEVRKLTSFGAESHLLFDSENTLLFSSVRKHEDKAKDGKEKTVFYRLSLKGGEAERPLRSHIPSMT